MKNKKTLIIIIVALVLLAIIIIANFFNKDITGKPGELIGDAVGTIEVGGKKVKKGSVDDPNSNINKLLKLEVDREVIIPEVETMEMNSDFSIKYTDVKNDKFYYSDFSESAKDYLILDSYSGVYVLNVLGRACEENKIKLSSMNFAEDVIPEEPGYCGVIFESNKYQITIFFKDDNSEANVKIEIIG